MKVYHFAGTMSTIYRARKTDALREARRFSSVVGNKVEVWRTEVRNDLPKMILIEHALNGGNWGTGSSTLIASFEHGKTVQIGDATGQVAA